MLVCYPVCHTTYLLHQLQSVMIAGATLIFKTRRHATTRVYSPSHIDFEIQSESPLKFHCSTTRALAAQPQTTSPPISTVSSTFRHAAACGLGPIIIRNMSGFHVAWRLLFTAAVCWGIQLTSRVIVGATRVYTILRQLFKAIAVFHSMVCHKKICEKIYFAVAHVSYNNYA
jgi:hypothetical protein